MGGISPSFLNTFTTVSNDGTNMCVNVTGPRFFCDEQIHGSKPLFLPSTTTPESLYDQDLELRSIFYNFDKGWDPSIQCWSLKKNFYCNRYAPCAQTNPPSKMKMCIETCKNLWRCFIGSDQYPKNCTATQTQEECVESELQKHCMKPIYDTELNPNATCNSLYPIPFGGANFHTEEHPPCAQVKPETSDAKRTIAGVGIISMIAMSYFIQIAAAMGR